MRTRPDTILASESEQEMIGRGQVENRVMCTISGVFRFRIVCHKLCNHPYYCNVILLCILISSMMLAAEDPLFANIERNQASVAVKSTDDVHMVQ